MNIPKSLWHILLSYDALFISKYCFWGYSPTPEKQLTLPPKHLAVNMETISTIVKMNNSWILSYLIYSLFLTNKIYNMRILWILYLIKRFAHLYSPLRQIVINRSIISNNISPNESNISFSYIYICIINLIPSQWYLNKSNL